MLTIIIRILCAVGCLFLACSSLTAMNFLSKIRENFSPTISSSSYTMKLSDPISYSAAVTQNYEFIGIDELDDPITIFSDAESDFNTSPLVLEKTKLFKLLNEFYQYYKKNTLNDLSSTESKEDRCKTIINTYENQLKPEDKDYNLLLKDINIINNTIMQYLVIEKADDELLALLYNDRNLVMHFKNIITLIKDRYRYEAALRVITKRYKHINFTKIDIKNSPFDEDVIKFLGDSFWPNDNSDANDRVGGDFIVASRNYAESFYWLSVIPTVRELEDMINIFEPAVTRYFYDNDNKSYKELTFKEGSAITKKFQSINGEYLIKKCKTLTAKKVKATCKKKFN